MTERKSAAPIDFKLADSGEVTVAFSRLNVIDSDRDVTFPGALPVGKAVAMSDYGHTSWDGAKPVGKGSIREDGDLGIFDGRFFLSTTHGRDAYETVKEMGELQEWSYGYVVLDGQPGTFKGERVRELRKLDVFEVSPVLKGAGVGTSTLAIKSGSPGADGPYAEHASWVHEVVKAFADRSIDRDEWRQKEGRRLSNANRALIAAIIEAHDGTVEQIDRLRALLGDTEPEKAIASPVADRMAMDLIVEIERARSLGVPI
jgi:hypothetical protein